MKILLLLAGAGLAIGQPAEAPKKIRVAGTVLALNGEPVRKATVRMQGNGGVVNGQIPATLTESTGNDGKFAFEDVPPGRYTLSAEKAGFVTQRYGARSNSAAGTPLILTAGQELKDLSMQMTPQGIISGHVSDLDGDPVPNVVVYLQRYTYVRGRRTLTSMGANQTNDQGDYRFANLAPGRYYAYALDRRGLTTSESRSTVQEVNVQTYYPNATEPGGAAPLDVPAGGELRGINIQLRKGRVYAIRGKLLDQSTGTSPGGIPVDLTSQSAPNSGASRVPSRAADGGFEFRNVAAGTYLLRAMPTTRTVNGQTTTSTFTGRTEVTVADASVDNVVLSLRQGFEIEGAVKLEDGDLKTLVTPPAAAATPGVAVPTAVALGQMVALVDGQILTLNGGAGRLSVQLTESYGGTMVSVPQQQVKEDGTFKFQGLAASTYLFNVGVPDGTYVKSVKFGGQDVTRSPIEISGGGTMAIVLSSKAGGVSGAVHDSKGAPMGGYSVTLWPKIPELGSMTGGIKQATTDQSGAFKFPSLAPGEYYVAAWDDLESGLAQSGEFVGHFNSEATVVKVAESGQANVDVKVISRERIAAEVAKLP